MDMFNVEDSKHVLYTVAPLRLATMHSVVLDALDACQIIVEPVFRLRKYAMLATS